MTGQDGRSAFWAHGAKRCFRKQKGKDFAIPTITLQPVLSALGPLSLALHPGDYFYAVMLSGY